SKAFKGKPLQGGVLSPFAKAGRIQRTDPVDADLVNFPDLAPVGDREGEHIPEGIADIGEQKFAPNAEIGGRPFIAAERILEGDTAVFQAHLAVAARHDIVEGGEAVFLGLREKRRAMPADNAGKL